LTESGELASLMADSELKQFLNEEIKSAVTEELTSSTNQKTNLEEATSVAQKQAVSTTLSSLQCHRVLDFF
jgi:hypothetical protein